MQSSYTKQTSSSSNGGSTSPLAPPPPPPPPPPPTFSSPSHTTLSSSSQQQQQQQSHVKCKFDDQCRVVKITNLPSRTQNPNLKENLYDEFIKYGRINSIRIEGEGEKKYVIFYLNIMNKPN